MPSFKDFRILHPKVSQHINVQLHWSILKFSVTSWSRVARELDPWQRLVFFEWWPLTRRSSMRNFNPQFLFVGEKCHVGYIKGFWAGNGGRGKHLYIFKNYILWPFFMQNFKSIGSFSILDPPRRFLGPKRHKISTPHNSKWRRWIGNFITLLRAKFQVHRKIFNFCRPFVFDTCFRTPLKD